MKIRDARPDDRGAIEAVTLAAYGAYASVIPQHWDDYRESILATLADVAPAQQIVAELDAAIVGTVLLYPAGSVLFAAEGKPVILRAPEVRLLAVAPTARGRGIGAALMRECVERARRAGAPVLTLHTADIMQVAVRLYERMGFARAPDLDFRPVPDLHVKGYRLELGPEPPSGA